MGSTENLAAGSNELANVFANRRRRRRSATPVKIGGILMGDGTETEPHEKEELPFGNKRNSYHPGLISNQVGYTGSLKRHSNIGMWGQRTFTNGHTFGEPQGQKPPTFAEPPSQKPPTFAEPPSQKPPNLAEPPAQKPPKFELEKDDVNQFLTDMHSEIKAMTNSLCEVEQQKSR